MVPLYFPKLIQINNNLFYVITKWLWFVPNLMHILSIFLKLQAVKRSCPAFLAYPVYLYLQIFKMIKWYQLSRRVVLYVHFYTCAVINCATVVFILTMHEANIAILYEFTIPVVASVDSMNVVITKWEDPQRSFGEQFLGMWYFLSSVFWHCWLGNRTGIWGAIYKRS